MKTLVITTEKGGVGKTTLSVQLAFYLALRLSRRVLVLDLDVQNNASRTITMNGKAATASFSTYDIFTAAVTPLPQSTFVLVPEGDRQTLTLEGKSEDEQGQCSDRLFEFLRAVENDFDVCIMDTGPRPDFPHYIAMMHAQYFLTPLQLSQHALDGVGEVLYSAPYGYQAIKKHVNPALQFLGILPVLFEAKRVQKGMLAFVEQDAKTSPLLLRHEDNTVARIPRVQAMEEAQNNGIFIGDMRSSPGREAWTQVKPVFDLILRSMAVSTTQ